MISSMAGAIVRLLEKQHAIDPKQREVYIYGCDIALYTLISTLSLLMIGFVFGLFLETLICIAVFYLNQSLGGGYHADTHMQCFLTMAAGLLAYILSFSFLLCSVVYIILGYLSLLILFSFPLVLHKHKAYLIRHKNKLIMRSRISTSLQLVFFSLIIILSVSSLVQSFASAFTLCAASRLAAKYTL